MGIYCYTLRKRTRTFDGVEIGKTEYAYKCHWGDHDDPYCKRQHAAAARARAANPKLELVIMGDWKYASEERGTPVFKVSTSFEYFLDGCDPGPIVGYLHKVRGRYVYKPKVDA